MAQASVQVALLDVNLAGEMVYPVASGLRELGVPFIFYDGLLARKHRRAVHGGPNPEKTGGPRAIVPDP